jgi:hypothetical protein
MINHNFLSPRFRLKISFALFSLALLCVLSANARAQTVTFDTSSRAAMFYDVTQQLSQTLSWTHTVGAGTNRILIVGISTYSTAAAPTSRVTSVTYGTVTMTRIGTLVSPATIASDNQSAVEMFYLGEAGIASAANTTITATFNTLTPLQYAVGGSASFFGVNQSQPFKAQSSGDNFAQSTGMSSAPSVTLLSAANQIALDTLASSPGAGFFAPSMGQTRLWFETSDNTTPPFSSFDVGAGSMKPGASPSVATSWTLTNPQPWALRSVSILPSSQPTAAEISISGRIVTSDGAPIEGATVMLGGAKSEKTITDADGRYSFDALEAGGFYTVTPARANFSFAPASRSISTFAAQADALFTANADTSPLINPLDTTDYFVRQQYIDFLNREPDQAGFAFWTNEIDSCGGDAACIDVKRQNVSAAFFLSTEFQQTGFFIYQLYKAAFGRMARYQEFMPDTRAVGQGVIVGAVGWQQKLEQNKESFVNDFVARSEFKAAFDSLTNAQLVDMLNANIGNALTIAEREAFVNDLNAGGQTRAGILRHVAENQTFARNEFKRAFVLMQYFGYLRRNPTDAPDGNMDGFNFWLAKLDSFNGDYMQAQMIEAFISSQEYRRRFAR